MSAGPRPPRTSDLQKAYEALIHRSPAPPDSDALASYSQWARFDPRLAELWVRYVWENWKEINPIRLRASLQAQPWPAAAAVLLEFVDRAVTERRLFRHWKLAVIEGITEAPGEQFFIGLRKPGGKAMFEDARFSLAEYRKWGYLGRAIPFNKQMLPAGRKGATHTLDPRTRLEVIRSLLETSSPITARIYREATGGAISIRQAERDLANCRLLRAHGTTRGKHYSRAVRARRK